MSRLFFAVACVALVWSITNSSAAQPKTPPAPLGRWPHEIKGYGETVETARTAARNKAVEELATYLRQQSPPLLDDEPLDDAVRRRLAGHVEKYLLLDADGEQGPEVDLPNVVRAKSWVLISKERPSWNALLQAEEANQRHYRAGERRVWTGRFLGVVGAILLVGFAYVRLDEATRGQRTQTLRTAAAATLLGLVAAAVAWWRA